MRITCRILCALVLLGAFAADVAMAASARAASAKAAWSEDAGSTGSETYRSWQFSIPIVTWNREAVGRLECNLAGQATLALEGQSKRRYEEINPDDAETSGESLSSSAVGGALFVSRYTKPWAMAGLYWSLGVGFRRENVSWHVRPDATDPNSNFSLVDEEGVNWHEAELSGATGHVRFGYRYVGTEMPLLAGAYLGARHFQAGARDRDLENDEAGASDQELAPMTGKERDQLRRRYATRPEIGLEIGFSF